MLDLETARMIAFNACIDKLGRDFVFENCDYTTSGFGESEYGVFCFIGIDLIKEQKDKNKLLTLDNCSQFTYRVSCHVNFLDGIPTFLECVIPEPFNKEG